MAVRRLAQQQPASFAFTPENQAWAEAKVRDYPEGRQASAVIPILWKAQEQHDGWLPEPAIRLVADMLGMPYIRVLEVATFYTMFQLGPVGRVAHVNVCGTTPCMLRGSEDIIAVCRKKIAPRPFELSPDGRFSWEEVECAGACVNAPMVQIGRDTFEDLTPASFEALLDALARGGRPAPGPQSPRRASEPVTGPTTLTGPAKDDHVEAGPEDEAAPDTTPTSDVDPTSPAAANQEAARPDPRDRPDVEATRQSDAPARDGSPVAPEPQTSGQPGGVDEPERQKSAAEGDAADGTAPDAGDAAATSGDAQPGAGVETLSAAEAVDQAQADRAAPQHEFADHVPDAATAGEAASDVPQSPPSLLGEPEPEADPAASGETDPAAAEDAAARSPARPATAEDDASQTLAGAATAEDTAVQGPAEPAPAEADVTSPAAVRGGGAADDGVWGEAAHADAPRGGVGGPAGDSPGADAASAEDADAAVSRPDVPGLEDAGERADRPDAAGGEDAPPSAGEIEEAMDAGTLVDVAPPAPGTPGDPATHPHPVHPAPDDAAAGSDRAEGAAAGDDLPAPPDLGAAARADAAGRRPPPLRAEAVTPDNLKRISGIGPVLEKTLNKLGIFTLAQIAGWDQSNREWVATYLAFKGRIDRERWVEQAQELLARDKAG